MLLRAIDILVIIHEWFVSKIKKVVELLMIFKKKKKKKKKKIDESNCKPNKTWIKT